MEIRKYVEFFMRFDHLGPLFDKKKLLAPNTTESEAQAYVLITFISIMLIKFVSL